MIKQVYVFSSNTGNSYYGQTKEELINKVFDYKIENNTLYYRWKWANILVDKEYKRSISFVENSTSEFIHQEAINKLYKVLEGQPNYHIDGCIF